MYKKLLILGDISYEDSFSHDYKKTENILGEVKDIIKEDTYVVANLECPITDNMKPIIKTGPSLKLPKRYSSKIINSGIHSFSLSNNHIFDYGVDGLFDTVNILKNGNINCFGIVGVKDVPLTEIVEISEKKVGIISYSEHEFTKISSYETNMFNPYTSLNQIQALKDKSDYVVIMYHGGIEHNRLPSPLLMQKCRSMIDSGADMVICQHSHCIGLIDTYKNKTISYGQGNTIYGHRKNEEWNKGLAFEIDFTKNNPKLNMYHIEYATDGLKLNDLNSSTEILKKLLIESELLKNPEIVKNEWIKYCKSQVNLSLPLFFGWPKIMIRLNRVFRGLLHKMIISPKMKRVTLNLTRCDSHNEVIKTILSMGNEQDK